MGLVKLNTKPGWVLLKSGLIEVDARCGVILWVVYNIRKRGYNIPDNNLFQRIVKDFIDQRFGIPISV